MNTDNERVEKLLKAMAPPECDSEQHRRQVREQVLARLNTDRPKAGVSRGWRTATLLLGLLCVAATASQVAREMKMSQARRVHYEGRDDEGTYHFTVEQPESTNTDSGFRSSTYSRSGGAELSAAEIERARKEFEEIEALSQKKAGELEGVSDITVNGKFWHRTFQVKYTLSDGRTTSLGQGDPDPGKNPPDEEFEESPQGVKRSLSKSDWAEIRKLHNQGKPLEKYYRTVKGRLFKFSPVRYVLSDGTEVIMSSGRLCQGDTDSLILWLRAVVGPTGSPSVDESLWEMKMENLKKAPPVVIIRPTQYSDGGTMGDPTGPLIARNLDFRGVVSFAFPFARNGSLQPFNRERILLPANAPDDNYDLMFTVPGHSSKPVQEEIVKQFGLTARTEVRPVDALLLKVKDPARLAAHLSKSGSKMEFKNDEDGAMAWTAFPIAFVADFVEGVFHKPVVVSDGLSERYDIALKAREQSQETLPRALDEAGLELVPGRQAVEMLVVGKVGELVSTSTNAAAVDESLWEMKLENLKKAPPIVIIRPAQFSGGGTMGNPNGPLIAHNLDLRGVISFAYPFARDGAPQPFNRERILLPANAPDDNYDLMFTLRGHSSKPLQEAITKQLGFTARKEARQTDILLLKVKDPARLAAHARKPGSKMEFKSEGGAMIWSAFPMSFVADLVEGVYKKPVLVSGELSGRYDMALQADEQTRETLPRALGEAGLELVPGRQAVEMLVVENAGK